MQINTVGINLVSNPNHQYMTFGLKKHHCTAFNVRAILNGGLFLILAHIVYLWALTINSGNNGWKFFWTTLQADHLWGIPRTGPRWGDRRMPCRDRTGP